CGSSLRCPDDNHAVGCSVSVSQSGLPVALPWIKTAINSARSVFPLLFGREAFACPAGKSISLLPRYAGDGLSLGADCISSSFPARRRRAFLLLVRFINALLRLIASHFSNIDEE